MKRQKEFILSKQVLKSGTSIGANIEDADAGQLKKDFIASISIASKEAWGANYCLRLIKHSKLLDHNKIKPVLEKSPELVKLTTIKVKTSQENLYDLS